MGSRVRSNPSNLLVCWCEVVAGQGKDQPPWIIQKFPNTFDDQQMLNSIPQFVFPCRVETAVVQSFSFVLTALDSTFTFGFCRHSPNSVSAMVILSHLPWDSTFFKVLNQCSELQSSDSPDDVWSFLKALYQTPIPDPGTDLTVTFPPNSKMFVTKCPNHLILPSLPENRNLLEYYNAVDTDAMMVVFASMLFERRIIVTSRHLHRLSACVQAANALLYPMTWQHIYIPIMPEPLLDYLLAPMPFLIGVPHVLMQRVHMDEVGDVVYLNADTSTVETPFNDLAELPNEVSSCLRRKLNQPAQGMGDTVPRAFLRALVMLIGNYRDALQFREDERKVSFNAEKFIASRPHHLQVFVEKMLDLQIFRQFLEERLDLVNKGEATSDEFEMEVSIYSDRPRRNFQHLLHAVKKEGGAIVKTLRSKTNPAVKSAVKSVSKSGKQVKERSQEKYKEIRGKMKLPNTRSPEHTPWSNDRSPRSAPSSPSSSRRLPSRSALVGGVVTAKASYRRAASTTNAASSSPRAVSESVSSSSFQSPQSPGHTPVPPTIDLVGDVEHELCSRLADPSTVRARPSHTAPLDVSSGLSRPVTRPTTLPPPVPNTRSNTTLGTTTTGARDNSPSRPMLATSKDQDLILLGSPQDEDFDPLMGKSLQPSPPTTDTHPSPPPRHGPPHPIPSFLHSNANTARHDLMPNPISSSSSSSSIGSIYQPYLPFNPSNYDTKSPADTSYPQTTTPTSTTVVPPPVVTPQPLGIPTIPSRSRSTVNTSSTGGTSPAIPLPARRTSVANYNTSPATPGTITGGLSGMPSSTMAALPAALQNHLANKLDHNSTALSNHSTAGVTNHSSALGHHSSKGVARNGVVNISNIYCSSASSKEASPPYRSSVSAVPAQSFTPEQRAAKSVFDDPRYLPFSSLQSVSSHTMHVNPMYNQHQVPFPGKPGQAKYANGSGDAVGSKPNLAAAFANTLLSDNERSDPNSNDIDSQMLLSEYSDSFAQMKLNKRAADSKKIELISEVPQKRNENKKSWTSFE